MSAPILEIFVSWLGNINSQKHRKIHEWELNILKTMQSSRLENMQQKVRKSGNMVKVGSPSAANQKTHFFWKLHTTKIHT